MSTRHDVDHVLRPRTKTHVCRMHVRVTAAAYHQRSVPDEHRRAKQQQKKSTRNTIAAASASHWPQLRQLAFCFPVGRRACRGRCVLRDQACCTQFEPPTVTARPWGRPSCQMRDADRRHIQAHGRGIDGNTNMRSIGAHMWPRTHRK